MAAPVGEPRVVALVGTLEQALVGTPGGAREAAASGWCMVDTGAGAGRWKIISQQMREWSLKPLKASSQRRWGPSWLSATPCSGFGTMGYTGKDLKPSRSIVREGGGSVDLMPIIY